MARMGKLVLLDRYAEYWEQRGPWHITLDESTGVYGLRRGAKRLRIGRVTGPDGLAAATNAAAALNRKEYEKTAVGKVYRAVRGSSDPLLFNPKRGRRTRRNPPAQRRLRLPSSDIQLCLNYGLRVRDARTGNAVTRHSARYTKKGYADVVVLGDAETIESIFGG